MGALFDYFVAPSDAAAADTVNQPAGPRASGFPTVDGKGIEPVVALGKFDELLTGRDFDTRIADVPQEPLATSAAGEQFVIPISAAFLAALADTDESRLAELTPEWASIEEFGGTADPGELTLFLTALQDLARTAGDDGGRVYVWMSV